MAAPKEIPSKYNSAPPHEEEDDEVTINDVGSLRGGIIKTLKNNVQADYTILLVGETGVGKSAVLEFIANVLIANNIDRYNFEILDRSNEENGSSNQSQTNSARLYKLTSSNGIVVRILDTPGLADTRGMEQDEHHKRNIATEIQKHINSVTAVLILANGTVPRITVGTDYAMSTLSAIFPKSLADNIAFVFTNVPSPLSWNFSRDTIPDSLRDAEQFLLDNPVALQKKYLALKDDSNKKKVMMVMRKAVLAGEERALEEVVKLFDWLDGLAPQPTTEIVYLYDMSQGIEAMIANTLAQMDQAATKKVEIDKLIYALKMNSKDTDVIRQFEKTITMAVWKQRRSPTFNMICDQADCYSNCHIDYKPNISHDLNGFFEKSCDKCNHSLWNHHRCRREWETVMNTQASVDQSMREWEAAKDGTEKRTILLAVREKVLQDLDQIINGATKDLAQQVERYARLSLSGSFSAQVGSAVRLLEQNYIGLEKKGVGQDHLHRVKESLGNMRRKLEILDIANEKARKERVEISHQ